MEEKNKKNPQKEAWYIGMLLSGGVLLSTSSLYILDEFLFQSSNITKLLFIFTIFWFEISVMVHVLHVADIYIIRDFKELIKYLSKPKSSRSSYSRRIRE
jgi:cytochrome b subunit of formate dehydrogenase|tara:strand:+ start:1427 stop:1726 length:300 start_codon:yes stop_codon:yes gene_type:complete